MKYTSGRFLRESYRVYDQWAKDRFSAYLSGRGHQVVPIGEDQQHDLITVRGGEIFHFELEVKTRDFTCEEDFPFDTVSFLARKKRLHDAVPFYYVVISYRSGCALCCHSSVIFEGVAEDVDINSPERPGLDRVYRVDKTKCYFFDVSKNLLHKPGPQD